MIKGKGGKEKDIIKDYYSMQELTKELWFPIKSVITLKRLIEKGRIKAIDISTNDSLKQYKIYRWDIIKFLKLEEK